MLKRRNYFSLISLVVLILFLFPVIIPIRTVQAKGLSRLAEAIKNLNGGYVYQYTTDKRVKEVIVPPTKVNEYESKFTGKDRCSSSLQHIYWTWDSTYARQVRTSDISYKTPVSPYVQGGGGLTYRTSTLLFYVIYKNAHGKEELAGEFFEFGELGNEFIRKFKPAFDKASQWSNDYDRKVYEQFYIDGSVFEGLITQKSGLTEEELKTIDKIHVAAIVHIRQGGKTVAL